MKKITALLSFLILFTAFTCENEPLEGDFDDDEGTNPALSCEEATQNTTTATTNFAEVTLGDANYGELCLAYQNALQDQIDACGDADGIMQTIIDSLGNCGLTDCELATMEADNAEAEYNIDSTNTDLCNAYKTALINQINACGDDGTLQTIIDDLGDCTIENPDLVLLKKVIETFNDGTTSTEIYSYDGNKLISIDYGDGEMDTFTYENELLVRYDEILEDPDGQLDTTYSLFEYDTQNRVITQTYYNEVDEASQKWDYDYNTDGTITETAYYYESGNEILNYVGTVVIQNGNYVSFTDGDYLDTYTYDDKNGSLKNIHAFETFLVTGEFYISKNNELSGATSLDGVPIPEDNYTISYTYNDDNYPITASFDFTGVIDDSTLEFFYE